MSQDKNVVASSHRESTFCQVFQLRTVQGDVLLCASLGDRSGHVSLVTAGPLIAFARKPRRRTSDGVLEMGCRFSKVRSKAPRRRMRE
eukprot:scaffold325_cov230-Pinguiococcus_pyrenoidosus.AAC.2